MNEYNNLAETMELLIQDGKGILAADESTGTIGKRFNSIHIENTEENRRNYREMLFTTPNLQDYISGVILYEETIMQKSRSNKPLVEYLTEKGIVPGIKVDKGLINLAGTNEEKISIGLDDLETRLNHYKQYGARFAKWRNVFSIGESSPSPKAMRSGAEVLARYASVCQESGIVPIVEPEILIDGNHTIMQSAAVCTQVLHEVFEALYQHHVHLEMMILKTSMVTCGIEHKPFSTPEEVAEYSLMVYMNTVPAAVPSINFLSGGQSPEQSALNLNMMNEYGIHPWNLSFSYGRALQDHALKTWAGKDINIESAQKALFGACHKNGLAAMGELNKEASIA
jgi:fructose-bisphosphate aldolase class I